LLWGLVSQISRIRLIRRIDQIRPITAPLNPKSRETANKKAGKRPQNPPPFRPARLRREPLKPICFRGRQPFHRRHLIRFPRVQRLLRIQRIILQPHPQGTLQAKSMRDHFTIVDRQNGFSARDMNGDCELCRTEIQCPRHGLMLRL